MAKLDIAKSIERVWIRTVLIGVILVLCVLYWYFFAMNPQAQNTLDAPSKTRDQLYTSASHVFTGRVLREVEVNEDSQEYQYEVETFSSGLLPSKGDLEGKIIVSSARKLVDFSKLSPHSDPLTLLFYTKYNYRYQWYAILDTSVLDIRQVPL